MADVRSQKHAPDLSCVSRNLKRDVQTFEGKTMSNCMWTIPLVCWRLHDKCTLQHLGYTYCPTLIEKHIKSLRNVNFPLT